jgi:hypothetical protein
MPGQAAKRTLILFTAFIFTILAYSLFPHFLKWTEENRESQYIEYNWIIWTGPEDYWNTDWNAER